MAEHTHERQTRPNARYWSFPSPFPKRICQQDRSALVNDTIYAMWEVPQKGPAQREWEGAGESDIDSALLMRTADEHWAMSSHAGHSGRDNGALQVALQTYLEQYGPQGLQNADHDISPCPLHLQICFCCLHARARLPRGPST